MVHLRQRTFVPPVTHFVDAQPSRINRRRFTRNADSSDRRGPPIDHFPLSRNEFSGGLPPRVLFPKQCWRRISRDGSLRFQTIGKNVFVRVARQSFRLGFTPSFSHRLGKLGEQQRKPKPRARLAVVKPINAHAVINSMVVIRLHLSHETSLVLGQSSADLASGMNSPRSREQIIRGSKNE